MRFLEWTPRDASLKTQQELLTFRVPQALNPPDPRGTLVEATHAEAELISQPRNPEIRKPQSSMWAARTWDQSFPWKETLSSILGSKAIQPLPQRETLSVY